MFPLFTVEGCSDPDLPDNMWLKHFGHEALVGCKTGIQTTWLLKCVKGAWEGQVGICSSGSASLPVLLPSKNKGTVFFPIFLFRFTVLFYMQAKILLKFPSIYL